LPGGTGRCYPAREAGKAKSREEDESDSDTD
jgi:hypothetical protein